MSRYAATWLGRGYSAISVIAAVAAFFFLFVLVFALEVATTLRVYGYFAVTVLWVEAMGPRLRRLTWLPSLATAPIAPCPVSW
jgi:hypothetical protein